MVSRKPAAAPADPGEKAASDAAGPGETPPAADPTLLKRPAAQEGNDNDKPPMKSKRSKKQLGIPLERTVFEGTCS